MSAGGWCKGAGGRGAVLLGVGLLAWLLGGCSVESKGTGPKLPYTPKAAEPLPKVQMVTSKGELEIELFEDDHPNAVANFITLAEAKFYDGLLFHRIEPGFCIQGGCPKGDGTGDPGYKFEDEFYENPPKNTYGTLAMANSGPNTNGSQFFFNTNKSTKGNQHLDNRHMVFGKVTKGLEVVEEMAKVKTVKDLSPAEREKLEEGLRHQLSRPVEPLKILSVKVLQKRSHDYQITNKVPKPVEAVVPIPAPDDKAKAPGAKEDKGEKATPPQVPPAQDGAGKAAPIGKGTVEVKTGTEGKAAAEGVPPTPGKDVPEKK